MAKNTEITTGTLNYLQKLFKIKVNKNAKNTKDVITPNDTTTDGKDIKFIKPDAFTPQVQRLYDFWVTTYFDKDRYEERQNLWSEVENLYFNDSICARNVNIRSDETVQADSGMQCVSVEGNKKQVDFILNFFDDIQLYPKIRPTAFDLNLFGNHVWILGINGAKGIEEVVPTDIFSLTERLEFCPAELEQKMLKNSQYSAYFSQDRIAQLVDAITNKDNITSVHKKYLLGFIINNYVLPPWRVLHFRNDTTRSPFAPFGVPGIIHSLAPYKQWDAAMTFQVMARAASFPIDKYTLNLPNVIDDAEKFNVLLGFIEKLDNIGIRQSKKDDKNLGDRIFTIKELFDFEQIESNIDIGKIADIDMLKDERIIASGLPRNIIDPNDGGFGDSGVSLVQKWKELARSVFHQQHIILDNLTQLCKLQMILTNSFSVDEFDFILSMPFPESQTNGDLINNQKDTMDLFITLVDGLSDKFLGGEPLPVDLMRDILTQVMPYDQRRLEDWISQIEKARKAAEAVAETDDGGGEEDVESDFNFESREKRNTKRFMEGIKKDKTGFTETVTNEFIRARQSKLREGTLNNKHYFSSKNNYSDFQVSTLRKMDKKILAEMGKDVSVDILDKVIDLKKKAKKQKKR